MKKLIITLLFVIFVCGCDDQILYENMDYTVGVVTSVSDGANCSENVNNRKYKIEILLGGFKHAIVFSDKIYNVGDTIKLK